VPVPKRYEIRLVGHLDEDASAALAYLSPISNGNVTVIDAELDQAGRHGLLERIRTLGIELLDIRQVRSRQ
jgi:hypothetical protein